MDINSGVIVRALSGFYYVDTGESLVECRARGKFRLENIKPLVGDKVEIAITSPGYGVIEAIKPRKNRFVRPAVANVDAIVEFAAAVNPVTDPFLLDRISAIASSRGAETVICINKSDLNGGGELREIYEKTPFRVINTSAVTGQGLDELLEAVKGKICALTGNSGVGKSSILNAISPGLDLNTGEVSNKLGRGRHTTRHVEMFGLPNGAFIIDTPGFSSFDTQAEPWKKDEIQYAFPEFSKYITQCRFVGCSHVCEKGCAVLEAIEKGTVHPKRHASYVRLYKEASLIKEWETDEKRT